MLPYCQGSSILTSMRWIHKIQRRWLFKQVVSLRVHQEAYTGEITQEWRSFKATFEAVTSPRRK